MQGWQGEGLLADGAEGLAEAWVGLFLALLFPHESIFGALVACRFATFKMGDGPVYLVEVLGAQDVGPIICLGHCFAIPNEIAGHLLREALR